MYPTDSSSADCISLPQNTGPPTLSLLSIALRMRTQRLATAARRRQIDDSKAANFATAFHSITGVKLFIGSKVLYVFCSEICTPQERGGEKGGSANFKTNHTEPLTQVIP